MNIITGPISAIAVALIVTLGTLFGAGALNPNHTYATVQYDGGYKKIGIISSEDIFSEVQFRFEGRQVFKGDVAEAIEWINDNAVDNGRFNPKTTFNPGFRVKASAGIRWVGSESQFKLTTDSLQDESTQKKPLSAEELVNSLTNLERTTKANRVKQSKESLTYGPTPNESFLLSKLIAALSR